MPRAGGAMRLVSANSYVGDSKDPEALRMQRAVRQEATQFYVLKLHILCVSLLSRSRCRMRGRNW